MLHSYKQLHETTLRMFMHLLRKCVNCQ